MSTLTLSQPTRLDIGPEDTDHYVCCDENTAMCGYDVTSAEWVAGHIDRYCPLCVALIDGPCSSPSCPDRAS